MSIIDNCKNDLIKLKNSNSVEEKLFYYNKVLTCLDKLDNYPLIEIDQPIYELRIDWQTNKYYLRYGYVSSLRQDKNKKWSFRFSCWYKDKDIITNYDKSPIIDKAKKDKIIYEALVEDVYINGEYNSQHYFIDFNKAIEILKQSKTK